MGRETERQGNINGETETGTSGDWSLGKDANMDTGSKKRELKTEVETETKRWEAEIDERGCIGKQRVRKTVMRQRYRQGDRDGDGERQ